MFGSRTIRLGKLFDTAIYLDPWWFLVPALYCLPHLMAGETGIAVSNFIVIMGIYLSVLAHEYAHIFTARAFNIRTPRVTMHLFGGAAHLQKMPWGLPEAMIAIAGPIFSCLLGLVLMSFSNPLVAFIGLMNIWLALFNMIPLPPLDGGRVARGILYHATGRLVFSTKVVTYFGMFVALPVLFIFVLPMNLWMIVLTALIILASLGEMRYIEKKYGGTPNG